MKSPSLLSLTALSSLSIFQGCGLPALEDQAMAHVLLRTQQPKSWYVAYREVWGEEAGS